MTNYPNSWNISPNYSRNSPRFSEPKSLFPCSTNSTNILCAQGDECSSAFQITFFTINFNIILPTTLVSSRSSCFPTKTLCAFYVYGSVHHNIFYE